MPIALFTGHAEEKRPSPNFPAVISKRPHLDGGIPHDPGPRSSRDKRIQSHAAKSRKGAGHPSPKHSSEAPAERFGEGCPAPPPYSAATPRYGRANPAILPNAGAATDPP